jgi:protein NrfD
MRDKRTLLSIFPGDGHGSESSLAYHGETYYELPALKPSHYRWPIVGYFFVGGLASAAQFIATVLDLLGSEEDRSVVRAGRYIALLGALISPILLIVDLETPKRWYNMLRIYRQTSPMSIGSWALTTFGTFSGFVAVGQAAADLFRLHTGRLLARLFSLPAALAGGVVSLYTGTLLAATSTPFWAGAFPFLSSLFASSAASTATAALALSAEVTCAPRSTRQRLTVLSVITGAAELLFAFLVGRRWRRRQVTTPVHRGPLQATWRFGVLGLGIGVPLVVHLVDLVRGRGSHKSVALASVATLAGGFLLRAVLIFGGNQSVQRPGDYFGFARPATRTGSGVVRTERAARRS